MKNSLFSPLATIMIFGGFALTGCIKEDFQSTLVVKKPFAAVATGTLGAKSNVSVAAGSYSNIAIDENVGFLGIGNNVSFTLSAGGKNEKIALLVPNGTPVPNQANGGAFALASKASGQPFDLSAKLEAQDVTDGDTYSSTNSCTYDCNCTQECSATDASGNCTSYTQSCMSCNGEETVTGYDQEITQNVTGRLTAPGNAAQVYATFSGTSDTTGFVQTGDTGCN